MRKFIWGIAIGVIAISIFGCSPKESENANNVITISEAENVISNYLDALSRKDVEDLKKFGTEEMTEGFNEETIKLLKETLKSAKLISVKIETSDKDIAKVDAKVEVICYDDSCPTGDWIPGKSISEKSFELINVDDEWKVNSWGY